MFVVQAGFAITAWAASGSAAAAYVLCFLVALWGLTSWLFNPAQQKRLVAAAGARAPVVLSLSASSLYAGQALGGVLGGLLVQQGPVSVATAAAACVLVALVVHFFSSFRERPLTGQGPSTAPVTPPVRSSV